MFNKERITPDMIYRPLDPRVATTQMNELKALIEEFLGQLSFNKEAVEWNNALLLKIIIRIDQRSDYFTYYHSDVNKETGEIDVERMSEYKKFALLCFWILKYKPLRFVDQHKEFQFYIDNRCTINEAFAAYIFLAQIWDSDIPESQKKYYLNKAYKKDLFYKFMHHDISKEAMIFALTSIVCCK